MKRRNLRRLTVLAGLSFIFSFSAIAQQIGESDVILQGFYWNTNPGDVSTNDGVWWDTLANAANELSEAGFKTVWTPPANKGFAGTFDMGYGVYDYYDFGSFDQKGTIRTRHGNTAQLQAMIDALHQAGLNVMADIVLNHRAGAEATQLEDCDDGGGLEQRFTEFRPLSGRLPADSVHFHPNSFGGHCDLFAPFHDRIFFEDLCYFNGLDQVLDGGAPDNGWYHGPHNLGSMGDSLIVWGRYLLDEMGFDELRLDAVKHIEPGFLAPFLAEMGAGDQPFAVGELFDEDVNALKSYRDQVESFNTTFGAGSKDANLAIFDFALRYALRDMANGGGSYDMWNLNTRGLRFNPGNGLPGEDIVTFVENHDVDRIGWVVVDCNDPTATHQIGNTCLKFSEDSGHDPIFTNKHLAYAYIMAAEGRPSVFYKDWYWYGLDEEIKWQMALRSSMATGASAPIQNLNPFFVTGHGGDLFVLNRYQNNNEGGLVLAMNDNPGSEYSAFVNTPFQNEELKDYSDAFMFFQTTVFNDTRCFVKAGASNYAWYAPTGQYPQPPGEEPSSFALGNHVGAKLHFVTIRAEDAAQLIVNGAPIAVGDEIAILPMGMDDAVGLGRIGQSFRWDGIHDVIVEVLGGGNASEAKGGLQNGDGFRVAVYDQSAGETLIADNVTFAPGGTNFDFSAKRPGSRGGSAPFPLTVSHGSQTYSVGGISLITSLEAGCDAPTASCTNTSISLDAMGNAMLSANQVDNGSMTDCEQQSLTVSPSAFTCADIGSNTVTLTITDVNNLSATCTANVMVVDGMMPSISCPEDDTVPLDENCQAFLADYTAAATVMDNCDEAPAVTQSPNEGTEIIGQATVTLTATDFSGNSTSCTFVVTTEDNEPPVAACLDYTVEFNGESDLPIASEDVWDEMGSSDNCEEVNFVDLTPDQVNCSQVGQVIPVTLTVDDASGNTGQCTAMVTVGGLPCGWSAPPGGVNCAGNEADYNSSTGSFSVTNEGCYDPNYYSATDAHGYAGMALCGDGEIIAQITEVNGNGWAGISMREGLSASAKMIQLSIDGNALTKRELRQSTGGIAFNHLFQTQGHNWLRITRSGNSFTAYRSTNGVNWSVVITVSIAMQNCIEIGLITENSAATGSVTGVFENVSISGGSGSLQSAIHVDQPGATHVGDWSVFPNPTNGILMADLSAYTGQKGAIRVYNNLGQLVKEVPLNTIEVPMQRIDLSAQQAGLYMLRLQVDGELKQGRKVMVVR